VRDGRSAEFENSPPSRAARVRSPNFLSSSTRNIIQQRRCCCCTYISTYRRVQSSRLAFQFRFVVGYYYYYIFVRPLRARKIVSTGSYRTRHPPQPVHRYTRLVSDNTTTAVPSVPYVRWAIVTLYIYVVLLETERASLYFLPSNVRCFFRHFSRTNTVIIFNRRRVNETTKFNQVYRETRRFVLRSFTPRPSRRPIVFRFLNASAAPSAQYIGRTLICRACTRR